MSDPLLEHAGRPEQPLRHFRARLSTPPDRVRPLLPDRLVYCGERRVRLSEGLDALAPRAAWPAPSPTQQADVVARVVIAARGDRFALHGAAHLGHLLGPLVDEQHDEVHFRMVCVTDCVCEKKNGFAGPRQRDDQSALALPMGVKRSITRVVSGPPGVSAGCVRRGRWG